MGDKNIAELAEARQLVFAYRNALSKFQGKLLDSPEGRDARDAEEALLSALAAQVAAEQAEASARSHCPNCGGREIPWGAGKCHCFKTKKGGHEGERHGAGAEGPSQDGAADSEAGRGGAGTGTNLGDEHRGATATGVGSAGYCLGESVRLPSRRELQEGIDLTPEAERIERHASPQFAAFPQSTPTTPKAAPEARKPLTVLEYNAIPELCAIQPSLYESIVRAVERAHGIGSAVAAPVGKGEQ